MGTTSRVKGLLDSVFTIPMVLPPTVCGFCCLCCSAARLGWGRWLIAHGISIVFTWPAAVISAVVVSFPLVYRTALGAFESLDTQMLDAARTLGWSERRIFTKLMMPLGWPLDCRRHGARLRARHGRVWLHPVLCGQLRRHYPDHPHRHLL